MLVGIQEMLIAMMNAGDSPGKAVAVSGKLNKYHVKICQMYLCVKSEYRNNFISIHVLTAQLGCWLDLWHPNNNIKEFQYSLDLERKFHGETASQTPFIWGNASRNFSSVEEANQAIMTVFVSVWIGGKVMLWWNTWEPMWHFWTFIPCTHDSVMWNQRFLLIIRTKFKIDFQGSHNPW